eukprot:CAMPEP_0185791890 /NCGR_PEP_ID=MMETSP1174-20130828/158632_1 /TAXON_ID=35687 /ORGANISM="Dictyocha speculum, Strain CCMP1381" /LENGTH=145 /DNA_ID=CAMNT_0028486899 /DNA_START=1285 /DNA_END=1722 /DNA_ORIENTATION=+
MTSAMMPEYITHAERHMTDMAASIMKALSSPIVLHQSPRKSVTPRASQHVPTALKVYADTPPRTTPTIAAGPLPTPPAIPADRVSRPAPATLFTRLKTDVIGEAVTTLESLPPPRWRTARLLDGGARRALRFGTTDTAGLSADTT